MKVKVYHAGYGCETGCCGHFVEIGEEERKRFEFTHPDLPRGGDEARDKAKREWAARFARETIEREWPECLPLIDWETLEFGEVLDD